MKQYENGAETKKEILKTAEHLYLTNGFWETSNADICNALFLNRSSIRYHFGNTENLRYEVLWDMVMTYRSIALHYFSDEKCSMLGAIYLQWCHMASDPRVRRFHVQYAKDYPVFVPNEPLSLYYRSAFNIVFGEYYPGGIMPKLNFSAAYGYLMSQMLLAERAPEEFSGKDLFLQGMHAAMYSWQLPKELIDETEVILQEIVGKIPPESLNGLFGLEDIGEDTV